MHTIYRWISFNCSSLYSNMIEPVQKIRAVIVLASCPNVLSSHSFTYICSWLWVWFACLLQACESYSKSWTHYGKCSKILNTFLFLFSNKMLVISLFVWFDSLRPINNLSVMFGWVFLGWSSTNLGFVSCSRTQSSDAGEAQTRGPSVSSQALYHWDTALRCWLLGLWFTIDNPYFDQMVSQIYPTELQLNKADFSDTEAPLFRLGLVHYL